MKKIIIASVLVLGFAGIAYAGREVALDPGTVRGLTTTSSTCFPKQTGRKAWCLVNPSSNTVNIRYSLSGTVTTTTGIPLPPGGSYCDPVAGQETYTGVVQCIAESGTPNAITWSY